jgi:hypothetical protein
MLQSVRDLQALVNQLHREVKKTRTKQIYQESVRNSTRAVVDTYFRTTRPDFKRLSVSDELLLPTDGAVHSLLETTHHHSAANTYKDAIKAVHLSLLELEKIALLHNDGDSKSNALQVDSVDLAITTTLKKLLPSAACSYEQAMRDLSGGARLSWRGPATDLREALRETLDHLAPDANVTAQPGFKLEANASGPTMKQKVRYILRQRGMSRGAMDTPESAVEAVEQAVGTFVRSVYSRSSISTHTPTDKKEVTRVRDWVRVVLAELLELR